MRGGVEQASLMLKIVIVQWMNTAFIIYFINSISEAPNEDYINQVRSRLTGVWRDVLYLFGGGGEALGGVRLYDHNRLAVCVFVFVISERRERRIANL